MKVIEQTSLLLCTLMHHNKAITRVVNFSRPKIAEFAVHSQQNNAKFAENSR